ncbi:MAG TPA: hypothetical protein O0X27_03100 [Methanocorpusculum sp.]|nr:hypothetical protein [Methanocorpusculum sp.]
MKKSAKVSCPSPHRMAALASGFATVSAVIEEIREFLTEIRKSVVSAYIDVQCTRYGDFLNFYSSDPAEVRMVGYLSCYMDKYPLFCQADRYQKIYADHTEWISSVREKLQEPVWNTLDESARREICARVSAMEETLKKTPEILLTSQRPALESARNRALNKPCLIVSLYQYNRYRRVLLELLHEEGVAYWHQSRKVSVQDTVDFSDLARSPQILHSGPWRLMPDRYATVRIDASFIDYPVLLIPGTYEFLQFFFIGRQNPGEMAEITLFTEKEVCTGTLSSFNSPVPDFDVMLKVDIPFRIDPAVFSDVPDGCEASLVFVPAPGMMNGYMVTVMSLPADPIGKDWDIPDDAVPTWIYPPSVPQPYTPEEIESYAARARFPDGFALSPSQLLDADVHQEWAFLPRNTAIHAISPKKFFTGGIPVSEWIFPVFHPKNPKRAGHDRIRIICQGTEYTGKLTYYAHGWGAVLMFPVDLVKCIYMGMETGSSRYHPYFLLAFESVGQDTCLLHFGFADESLSQIRNHNPAWQLKVIPRFPDRDAVSSACVSGSPSVFSNETDIAALFSSSESALLKAYAADPAAVLSFFMDRCQPDRYIVFRQRLDESLARRDARKNPTAVPVFVPQKVELDWDRVRSASADLDATAELLKVSYDDAEDDRSASSIAAKFAESAAVPVAPVPEGDDAWTSFVSALSPAQTEFIRVMLTDPDNIADLKRLARENGKVLETCFDDLNELALDTFGDIVIDDGGIIGEYCNGLSRALQS